ncbi:DUF2795 domain-containing protein [Streptomyces chrestomyceticus]|uniref:DUF2795 domain-containing protein n=1 Tax=Streptomyces chrestomyceticus TaxID=68185 RepID=UPI0037878604
MSDTDPIKLQKALKGAHYPASKDDLASCAKGNHADRQMMDKISHIPGKSYENPAEVEKAVFRNQ